MKRTVYIIQGKYGTDVFSNLAKLSKNYPLFTYKQLFYALSKGNNTTIGEYTLIKAIVNKQSKLISK